MKSQMTARDYELISAYLDNQLNDKDRALFETRLTTDPELRNELHEISKTRMLVHSLPKLRAPRNYYISATAVQKQPNLRLAPIFGIVSAIASVLLVIVIFGSTFLKSSSQVAMAPALPAANETIVVQQEVQRNESSPLPPTEAAPGVLMSAPLRASPTPNIGAIKVGPTEHATPTTIYLYVYPPVSTAATSNTITINEEQNENSRLQCEEYYGGSAYPTLTSPFDCPTPSNPISSFLENLPSPSPTPTATPTPTTTPTTTPTPTSSPTPTPSITPTLPVGLPSIQNIAPTGGAESQTGITSPDQALGAGNPTPSGQGKTITPGTSPNLTFLNYLFLTIEISLAAIAIIAGIAAIVIRIRAG